MRRGLVFLTLLVLAGAGCGGSDEPPPPPPLDRSAPAPLVRSLVRAAAEGRWEAVWSGLHPRDQRAVPRALFVRCLREVASGAAIPLSEIPIRVERVRGNESERIVEVRASTPVGPRVQSLGVARVGRDWRLRMPNSLARPLARGRCPAVG